MLLAGGSCFQQEKPAAICWFHHCEGVCNSHDWLIHVNTYSIHIYIYMHFFAAWHVHECYTSIVVGFVWSMLWHGFLYSPWQWHGTIIEHPRAKAIIILIVPYLSLYPMYQHLLELFICASSHIMPYLHLSCTKSFRSMFEHTTPPPNKNKRNNKSRNNVWSTTPPNHPRHQH